MSKLDAAKAFVAKNKVVLGLGGAAAVAGLALVRSKGSGDSASSSKTTTAPGTNAVGATGQAGLYDSTGSDVYNALQPQLEAVGNQYDELMELIRGGGSPIPVPSNGTPATGAVTTPEEAPRPSAPTLDGISTVWNPPNGGSIYQANLSDGTSVSINQNTVWSGQFGSEGGGYGTAAGGYAAEQADQIRDALAAKGLGYGREGNTGGGYTEESAGGRVQQALGGRGW